MMDTGIVLLLTTYLVGIAATIAWLHLDRRGETRSLYFCLECVAGAALWPLFVVLFVIDCLLRRKD